MLKTETSFFAKADLLLESSRLQTRETRRSFGIQSVSKVLMYWRQVQVQYHKEIWFYEKYYWFGQIFTWLKNTSSDDLLWYSITI